MIEGYPSALSVHKGEAIGLHLSDPFATGVTVRLHRYNIDGTPWEFEAKAKPQHPPAGKAWEGYRWDQTCELKIGSNIPPGLYELLDGSKNSFITSFVVKAARGTRESSVLLHIPMLTLQAYNGIGGESLYSPRISRVSLDRPHGRDLTMGWTEPLIRWMLHNGVYPDFAASTDLEDFDFLNRYDCLVLGYHDEYWTKAMRNSVERFVANGGNLVSLSGNTCMRQIRINGRMLELYRYGGDDPADCASTTVNYPQPPLNRSQVSLLGVGFTWGAEFAGETKGAYQLHFPEHWIVKGANATTGNFMHYETDAVDFIGGEFPRVSGLDGAPRTAVILGTADLRDWASPGWATMVYFRRSGEVFAAGTTEWPQALLADDKAVVTITKNVLGRLKSRRPAVWEDIGEANQTTGFAAWNDRLFVMLSNRTIHSRFTMCARMTWTRYLQWSAAPGLMTASSDTLYIYSGGIFQAYRFGESASFAPDIAPFGSAIALAYSAGKLYIADKNGTLHWNPLGRSRDWKQQKFGKDKDDKPIYFDGKGLRIAAMAAGEDVIYALAESGELYRTNKDIIGESLYWAKIDRPPLANAKGLAVVGWTLMAIANDRLYAMDIAGLRFRDPLGPRP